MSGSRGLGLWRPGLSSGQAGVGRRGECLPLPRPAWFGLKNGFMTDVTDRLTYCKKKKSSGD